MEIMEQQKVLRKRFLNNLLTSIKTEEGVALFRNNEFQVDEKYTLIMPHIEKPEGLIDKMDPNDDLTSAIALYEAYSELNPLEASDSRLWAYISIQDLYPYMIRRWPNVKEQRTGTNESNYILEHYLLDRSSRILRSWLSGLWWSVYLSIDESNNEDKYALTKVLFWNQTLRTRTMGTYLLARKKEIALGFLDYCNEVGRDNFGNFEKEHQEITEYLNLYGGSKPLSIFTRQQIKQLLKDRFDSN